MTERTGLKATFRWHVIAPPASMPGVYFVNVSLLHKSLRDGRKHLASESAEEIEVSGPHTVLALALGVTQISGDAYPSRDSHDFANLPTEVEYAGVEAEQGHALNYAPVYVLLAFDSCDEAPWFLLGHDAFFDPDIGRRVVRERWVEEEKWRARAERKP